MSKLLVVSEVFALRHKKSGRYMPPTMGRSARGWSWWEPTQYDPKPNRPRIFFTLRSAQNARSAWAQGAWKTESGGSQDIFGDYDEWVETVPVDPSVPRQLDDLEIVEFTLTETANIK